ncbi:MAG: ferritin-like domain-containing protein, partial [Microcystaceae cyanobacterium]
VDPLIRLIHEVGIPTIVNATTPLEEAIALLQVAAKVEHALLVQYLYAAYSLDAIAIDEQFTIVEIAEQEMGHLLTVQNLLLSIGGSLHLDRETQPTDREFEPFPFVLEPLSKRSLAKYVAAEMPILDSADPRKPIVDRIVQEAEAAAGERIDRVGVIYAKLYWLFQESDTSQGPWLLPNDIPFPSGSHLNSQDFKDATFLNTIQADSREWRARRDIYVKPVTNRQQALEAIYEIARQGEGPIDQNNSSHFDKFLEIYQKFDNFSSQPSLDVPTFPNTAEEPQTNPSWENGRITHPKSRLWAKLFNCRYHILLLSIAQSLFLNKTTDLRLRNTLIKWAFEEMMQGLRTTAIHLTTLNRSESDNGSGSRFAGSPFELPKEIIPEEKLEQWQLQKKLLEETNQLIEQLQQRPDINEEDQSLLDDLHDLNNIRTATIDTQIPTG